MKHDAVHLVDYGMAEAPDETVLERARQEDRILISADMDFPRIVALGGWARPSLVIFRNSVRSLARQIQRLSEYLSAVRPALEEGAIATFDHSVVRIRALPIEWRRPSQ